MIVALRPLVVLIVDDDPGDVLLVEDALRLGQSTRIVHVANDGHEAVAFLRRSGRFAGAPRPDLVLLDLNMPRMDGRQVLAEIKADEKLCSIPVVVLTTSGDPSDIRRSYALHANAYVTKPINLEDLTHAVHKIDEFFTRVATVPSQHSIAYPAHSVPQIETVEP